MDDGRTESRRGRPVESRGEVKSEGTSERQRQSGRSSQDYRVKTNVEYRRGSSGWVAVSTLASADRQRTHGEPCEGRSPHQVLARQFYSRLRDASFAAVRSRAELSGSAQRNE